MLERVTTGIVRERVHVEGDTREDRSTTLVVSGFKPRLPARLASVLSIALCPSGIVIQELVHAGEALKWILVLLVETFTCGLGNFYLGKECEVAIAVQLGSQLFYNNDIMGEK